MLAQSSILISCHWSDSVSNYVKDTNDWSLPLCGGDDYELCFTAGKSKREKITALSESLRGQSHKNWSN